MREQRRQPDFSSFSQVVRTWRETRGLSQAAVHQNGGPSDTTQSAIEAGTWTSARPYQTLAKVDEGFGWPSGTAAKILYEGYDPIADPPPPRVSLEKVPAPRTEDDEPDLFLYRRPDGLSDAEWERIKRDNREYLEWLINRAARER